MRSMSGWANSEINPNKPSQTSITVYFKLKNENRPTQWDAMESGKIYIQRIYVLKYNEMLLP